MDLFRLEVQYRVWLMCNSPTSQGRRTLFYRGKSWRDILKIHDFHWSGPWQEKSFFPFFLLLPYSFFIQLSFLVSSIQVSHQLCRVFATPTITAEFLYFKPTFLTMALCIHLSFQSWDRDLPCILSSLMNTVICWFFSLLSILLVY